MGINVQTLKAMLHENTHREISGKVLLIGKSTVELRWATLIDIVNSFGLEVSETDFRKRDTKTKKSSDNFWVDDVELLVTLFPNITSVDVLDVSPYEGANIIADMNLPVSAELHATYDFIYDSSVLDNIFNPAQMLSNIALMLRERGRVCLLNVASFYPGALCSCHPEWFYSFFAVNHFADAKVYLTILRESTSRFEQLTDLWRYRPKFTTNDSYDYLAAVNSVGGVAYTLVIAEMDKALSRSVVFPTNLQYIASSKAPDWTLLEENFSMSTRPLMRALPAIPPPQPHLTDHYEFLGSNF